MQEPAVAVIWFEGLRMHMRSLGGKDNHFQSEPCIEQLLEDISNGTCTIIYYLNAFPRNILIIDNHQKHSEQPLFQRILLRCKVWHRHVHVC